MLDNKKEAYKALKKIRIPLIILIGILILVRIFLEYIKMKKGLYLIHNFIYYDLNYIILILGLLLFIKNKAIRIIYYLILIILIGFNTFFVYKNSDNIQFQKAFSNGKNKFIIRELKDEPNFSLVYKEKYKLFMRINEKIKVRENYKPFMKGEYSIVWPNEDRPVIRCIDGKSKKSKAVILNFSKNNREYENVLLTLKGTWISESHGGNYLSIDGREITYVNESGMYKYYYTNTSEQGNYGIILYGGEEFFESNEAPVLYIVMNNNGSITIGDGDIKKDNMDIYYKK